MKAVILAGGFGTRLSEETGVKPKPMVEIGDKPILWHIMKIYSAAGIDDFILPSHVFIVDLQFRRPVDPGFDKTNFRKNTQYIHHRTNRFFK